MMMDRDGTLSGRGPWAAAMGVILVAVMASSASAGIEEAASFGLVPPWCEGRIPRGLACNFTRFCEMETNVTRQRCQYMPYFCTTRCYAALSSLLQCTCIQDPPIGNTQLDRFLREEAFRIRRAMALYNVTCREGHGLDEIATARQKEAKKENGNM